MKKTVLKHVLKNDLVHGKASLKAVMSKVLGEDPKLRAKAKEVAKEIQDCIGEVSQWKKDKKEKELLKMWPDAFAEKEEKEKVLPELKNAGKKVVVRFAPNPNGPPTLGSSRVFLLNAEYARKYKGKLICRFDDTDPETKPPLVEAYEWYVDDMAWLYSKPDKVVACSSNIETYYNYAEELIKKGACYVCFCSQQEFKKLRDAGKACKHRKQAKEETMKLWNEMLSGKYKPGECVLKMRTDIKHRDPAIRDWTCFRIISTPHPKTGKKFFVWPLLDFAGAVEDKLLGVTHILRGKELRDATERQKYLYDYLGWKYPEPRYVGRVAILEYGKLSTSAMAKAIAAGEYAGWDDPRLPTIRAMRRRGFQKEALKEFWLGFGVSEKDVRASLENLEAVNRKFVEKSDRLFFVPDAVEVHVKGIPKIKVELKNHPDFPKRGVRKYDFSGDQVFLVPEKKSSFRLKDAFHVEGGKFAGREVKPGAKLQWVVPEKSVDCEVVMPDGTRVAGKAEKELLKKRVGDVVQFERFGFVRVDEFGAKVTCWFAHK